MRVSLVVILHQTVTESTFCWLHRFYVRTFVQYSFIFRSRREAISDVISGVADDYVGIDIRVKFGGSRSKRSWVIRAAHFVMVERMPTAVGGRDNRQKCHGGILS